MLSRVIATISLLSLPAVLRSQVACHDGRPQLVGSEWERYTRLLQVVGAVASEPWTLRSFGPRQWTRLSPRDSNHAWREVGPGQRALCYARDRVMVLPARVELVHNSAFPIAANDGAVWTGRGVTASLAGGATASWGPLTMTLAPIAFVAQNAPFALRPNGFSGTRSFANWLNPDQIDLPQRFGSGRYARLDPGQSEIRLDIAGAALGFSTTNQFWGPATDHPIILGNNAAGLPRVFIGTSNPAPLWKLGRVHGQLFWGRASQSPYSPLADTSASRLVSGILVVYQPGILPGLEIGGGRFFHVLQERFRLDGAELVRPFGSLLHFDFQDQAAVIARRDNQLASIFLRFVAPGDGMEIYGEFGREDHTNSLRELAQLPDHDAAYLLGGRKAWTRGRSIVSLRAEVLNARVTHIARSSQQSPWYVHGSVRQGHTHRGEALGSAAGHGGGASVIALERYDEHGRTSVRWERILLAEIGGPGQPSDEFSTDVQHMLVFDALRFREGADVGVGLALVHEIDRSGGDGTFAIQARMSILSGLRRWRWWRRAR